MKFIGNDWHKTLWKIVTNPAIEVVAAIVLVIVATWFVISTEGVQVGLHDPVPFLHK